MSPLVALLVLVLMHAVPIALYGLPFLIAQARRHPDAGSIGLVNVFLGWTVIGWFWAFARAVSPFPEARSHRLVATTSKPPSR